MNTQNKNSIFPVYIALGTNLGDRTANLQAAILMLPPLVEIINQSPVYQTSPWGYEHQPDFLNQVILTKTTLSPIELLKYLKQIEIEVGRTPTFQYGPRVVDLDILFYDDWVIESTGLQIPHPRLHERAFVLVPFKDLDPGFRHPVLELTIQDMSRNVDSSDVVRFES